MRVWTFLALLLLPCTVTHAQWSDSSNYFSDSLHMLVSQGIWEQQKPVVVKSYPDGGYIVIWQDMRSSNNDLYAQKIGRDGNMLWTANGVPVATGPGNQQYTRIANLDYRNFSVACTDSAGGFYITWEDEVQIGSYNYSRVSVQHVRNDGTRVFADEGYVVANPQANPDVQYTRPQLIADGNKGFFIGFNRVGGFGVIDLMVYCMREENGVLKHYGGGQMDMNGVNKEEGSPCGPRNYIDYSDVRVMSFFIYPDLQGGCNVVMGIEKNSQSMVTAFNKLCRVKKDSKVTVLRRSGSDIANTVVTEKFYKKDSVVQLYSFTSFFNTVTCRGGPPNFELYVVTSYYVENYGNGFFSLDDDPLYYSSNVKGVLVPTTGNINLNIITANQRNLVANTTTPYFTRAYYRLDEKYDSLPYQLCSDMTHPYTAYRPVPTDGTVFDQVVPGNDTLLDQSSASEYDYTLTASGNRVFAAARMGSPGGYAIFLQQLRLNPNAANSYSVDLNTSSKKGINIGNESNISLQGISYNYPAIAVDGKGNAMLYVRDYYRSVRVSPIGDGVQLLWGAMGRPIGSGYYRGYPYRPENPYAIIDDNGIAVMAWEDDRRLASGDAYLNVFVRRIDSLQTFNYSPPLKKLKLLHPAGANMSVPAWLSGSSKAWTTIETNVYEPAVQGITSSTPVAALLDNYALGAITVTTYQHNAAIRTYNNKPYLNRNYTINVQNNPAGAANINLRLFFTQTEFDALQTADPLVHSIGDLVVIKQPNATNTAPTQYTPVTGEEVLPLSAWKAVEGGYYVEIAITGFSNFYIMEGAATLSVTWLDIKARRISSSQVNLSWQVAQESNVKEYVAAYSPIGAPFKDGCTVLPQNSTNAVTYSCVLPASANLAWTFRVRQQDNDGRESFSKIVTLGPSDQAVPITIGPNPAHDHTVLHCPAGARLQQAVLYDHKGSIVWQKQNLSGAVTIPLTTLSAGVYNLQITQASGTQTYKIVKQ